ncbi:transmembrane protein, putative (macronuclear) [Tetrahymena thermophila SB210]|uniref:Transmembrane protein, putative n=1 Tax=Tetrahymena thermophila (strain SB210) TaxID=312017 RepID=W7XDK7_TETTS|nr:transmembrane protein, putative [Tetrahymena thermophila SB210]EWS75657.1 transmembrane protein, putative [Tetrahymena thermophila SB210]|eukprot:XP_012651803.1 transmembrane protein, putative [Tetrahymena thermophila SB210]
MIAFQLSQFKLRYFSQFTQFLRFGQDQSTTLFQLFQLILIQLDYFLSQLSRIFEFNQLISQYQSCSSPSQHSSSSEPSQLGQVLDFLPGLFTGSGLLGYTQSHIYLKVSSAGFSQLAIINKEIIFFHVQASQAAWILPFFLVFSFSSVGLSNLSSSSKDIRVFTQRQSMLFFIISFLYSYITKEQSQPFSTPSNLDLIAWQVVILLQLGFDQETTYLCRIGSTYSLYIVLIRVSYSLLTILICQAF